MKNLLTIFFGILLIAAAVLIDVTGLYEFPSLFFVALLSFIGGLSLIVIGVSLSIGDF